MPQNTKVDILLMPLDNKFGVMSFMNFVKITIYPCLILTLFGVVMASKEESVEGIMVRKRNDFANPFALEKANVDKSLSEFGTQFLPERENDIYWKKLLITHTSYSFAYDRCHFDIGDDIVCHIAGNQNTNCIDFFNKLTWETCNSCQTEVDLSFNILNIGTSVESIVSLSTSVIRQHPYIDITRSIPMEERMIKPNDSVYAMQRASINFCDTSLSGNLDIQFALQCKDFDQIRTFHEIVSYGSILKPKSWKRKGSKGKSRRASHGIKDCIRTKKQKSSKVRKSRKKASSDKYAKKKKVDESFKEEKSSKVRKSKKKASSEKYNKKKKSTKSYYSLKSKKGNKKSTIHEKTSYPH